MCSVRTETLHHVYRCKNLRRHVQSVPKGFRFDPLTFWGPATALAFLTAQYWLQGFYNLSSIRL